MAIYAIYIAGNETGYLTFCYGSIKPDYLAYYIFQPGDEEAYGYNHGGSNKKLR